MNASLQRRLPLAAVVVTLVLWSSAFVAIRHLGHAFSPGAMALGRLVVGSLILGVVTALRGWTAPNRHEWPRLIAIGVLWYAVYTIALNAGEHRVDAGTAAMLIQVSPVLVAVLATIFLEERATRALGLGLAVAFVGVALIATSTTGNGRRDLVGVVLCLVSAAAYAVSLILQKPVVARLPALQVTWIACTVGAVVCLPFAGDLFHDVRGAAPTDVAWVVFLGAFPTAIAFTTYAYALHHMTASSLSVTTYLVPFIAVLLSWAFLAEVPPLLAYVGGGLALVGVAITRRKPRPKVVDEAAAPA